MSTFFTEKRYVLMKTFKVLLFSFHAQLHANSFVIKICFPVCYQKNIVVYEFWKRSEQKFVLFCKPPSHFYRFVDVWPHSYLFLKQQHWLLTINVWFFVPWSPQTVALSTIFARPLNLADICILRSGVKCLNHRLLASSDLTRLYKSPKWRDGLHLWSKGRVNFHTDFNSR